MQTELNDIFIDEANHIYTAMPMYNLTEYTDNDSDTPGSLWQFNRNKVPTDDSEWSTKSSQSFTEKAAPVGRTWDYVNLNSFVKDTKIVVPLKNLSNFWRSFEMPLIKCKVHLE